MKISKLEDIELIKLVKSSYEAVYHFDCYNPKDLIALMYGISELKKRGYHFHEHYNLKISKKGMVI